MESREITIEGPLDLKATLRTLGVGSFDESNRWWWATMVTDSPCTMMIERTTAGIRGTAWGSASSVLIQRLGSMIGEADMSEIKGIDERSTRLLRASSGIRLGATRDVHGAIVKAVLGQIVTSEEARRSLRSLKREAGVQAPGPNADLRTVPRPEVLGSMGYADLHRFGIERKRASVLIEVSRRSKRLAEILEMDREHAYRRLEAVRGVGAWTSALVMGTAWGDKDAVPTGDYHLPNTVAWALAGEDRANDDRMLELLHPFKPERRRMVVAIKDAGIHAPRYGPRTALRDHI